MVFRFCRGTQWSYSVLLISIPSLLQSFLANGYNFLGFNPLNTPLPFFILIILFVFCRFFSSFFRGVSGLDYGYVDSHLILMLTLKQF